MTASRLRILPLIGPVTLAAAAAGCAGDPPADVGRDPGALGRSAQPIIGGQVTDGDLAVVALTYAGTDELLCSGTLVSPRVVLTAGHCLDEMALGQAVGVFIGSDLAGPGARVVGDVAYVHPGWQVGGTRYDLGMVLLRLPADPTLSVRLNDVAGLDELVGSAYRMVGFGRHDRDQAFAGGKKRQGTTTITGYVGDTDVLLSGDDVLALCFGDSGGPGFITVDGDELLAGIHSFTSGDCRAPSGATRVDLYAGDVISPWIQQNDASCGADELCARIGCTGDPDCAPCGPDGTCADDCALPDLDCPTGAVGDICRADSQCASGLCVSWSGDADYRFCTEPCDPGAPDCPSGMSCQDIQPYGLVCTFDGDPPGIAGDACAEPTDCGSYLCDDGECVIRCDVSDGGFCPSGFECRQADGDDQFCHRKPDEGGCAVDHGASGLAAPFLLLVVALFTRRGAIKRRTRSRSR